MRGKSRDVPVSERAYATSTAPSSHKANSGSIAYPRWALILAIFFVGVGGAMFVPAVEQSPHGLLASVGLGAGLVFVSTGLTLGISVVMFHVSPAATAPALAFLYLIKVVLMGWWLLTQGAPMWLVFRPFAITVLAALMLSWAVLAPIAWRAGNVLGDQYRQEAALRIGEEDHD